MSAELDTVVVGAGAAGLGAAHELRARGREVLVLEASARPGGVMQTVEADGFRYERATNTFRISGVLRELVERAGIEGVLTRAAPESRARFLLGPEGLVPVPLGPLSLARTPILTRAGKRRLLREPFVARGSGAEESVDAFVRRRLGDEALEKLVAPFLVGVYAGEESRLGAEAVFPSLVAYERAGGSITVGGLRSALFGPRAPKGRPGTWSAAGGVGGLVDALVAALGPERVRTDALVQAVEPHEDGFRVLLEGETLRARRVLLAVEAPAAAGLLQPFAPEAARLCAEVRYAPLVAVPLDVEPGAARGKLEGFGFLVPRAAKLDLLGALFMSRLFPDRAPPGRELVHAMIGGTRWPEAVEAEDDTLVARVREGLDRALGTGDSPRPVAVVRWRRAVPQPGPEHPARVRALRAALEPQPGLALAGGWLDGVAVSAAFASGVAQAAALSEG